MGVRNLWKLIEPYKKTYDSIKGKKVAVDASIWMHQLRSVPESRVSYLIARRVLRILINGGQPLFVFDGEAPLLKRQAMEHRKELAIEAAMRSSFSAAECTVCGENMSKCSHSYRLTWEMTESLDNAVFAQMKEHGFDWGEFSSESFSEDSTEIKSGNGCVLDTPESISPIAYITKDAFSELTKTQRLNKLIELRRQRNLPMPVDTSSADALSAGQIENVKKRNLVRAMIDEIGNSGRKRVQGDWRYYIEYSKEERPVLKSNLGQSAAVEQGSEVLEMPSTPSQQNDLFELAGKVNSTAPHADSQNQSCARDAAKHAFFAKFRARMKAYEENPRPARNKEYIDFSYDIKGLTQPVKVKRADPSLPVPVHEESFYDKTDSTEYKTLKPIDNFASDVMDAGRMRMGDAGHGDEFVNWKGDMAGQLHYIQSKIKQVLSIFGVCFIDSPQEADAQCAYLFTKGIVDGIITEDNDLILYGATVYKNFFHKSKQPAIYEADAIMAALKITQKDLIKISFLLGSDYTAGIRGIGVKKAIENIGCVSDEQIAQLLKVYTEPVVHQIDGFENGKGSIVKLENLLRRDGICNDKIEELINLIKNRLSK